ncbi:hypothetical protein PVAP13_5KG564700 [Panicum virgatum]|uniref:Protein DETOXIFICATION n=1 Tax=Panicum virgatum TaxID=38727 RepID=A0A8T0SVY2_PANVG|nr:hypothetical protein PVAP13_5KG564700 [Panicum virgatum]
MSSAAPLLGSRPADDGHQQERRRCPSWLGRVVDTEEAWAQLRFSGPMILTNMFYYGIPLVPVMFSGHLGDVQLAGATLGNSWVTVTVTGYAFVIGLETLCGQAYGAGLHRRLGLYLQSSLIVSAAASALVSALVSALWVFTEPALLLLRQEPRVSRAAAGFVRAQIPGLFAFAALQCLLRYLQTQSVVLPLVAFSAASFALHVALAYLLVGLLGLGVAGASAAVSVTFWATCLMLLAYVLRSVRGLQRDVEGLLRRGVRILLVAGLLPNSTVSTSLIAICTSTETIAYMITYGFSACQVPVLGISFVLFLALCHDLWASLYSGSAVIVSEFAAIAPLLIVSIVLDSAQGVLSGVSRGCGWQHLAALTNLVAFYFVGMPLAIFFAFRLKYTKGLWAGLICGLVCQACSLLVITVRTKWSKIAEAMQQEKANFGVA